MEGEDAEVEFLVQRKNGYIFPKRQDISWVLLKDISPLPKPRIVVVDGKDFYTFECLN